MPFASARPVYFEGCIVFNWKNNRYYRVYARAGELYFIYAGSPPVVNPAAGMHFGLVGALVAFSASHLLNKTEERKRQIEGVPLDESLSEYNV